MRARVDANDHARINSFLATTNLPSTLAAILSAQLQAARDWLNEQNFDLSRAQHEVGFSVPASAMVGVLPKQSDATQWINGAIDLLILRGEEWSIIDFKTRSDSIPPEETPENYENQLRFYRAAARHCGYRIGECYLVFLDDNGAVSAHRVEDDLS